MAYKKKPQRIDGFTLAKRTLETYEYGKIVREKDGFMVISKGKVAKWFRDDKEARKYFEGQIVIYKEKGVSKHVDTIFEQLV